MRTLRLAEILVLKHAASNADHLEISLRADIHQLWKYPNELFNVLRLCANAGVSRPKKDEKSEEHVKVYEGYKFCQDVLSMIDYMKSKMKTISLGEIREILLNLVNLIQDNLKLHSGESGIQFKHVSDLIFKMVEALGTHGRKQRDELYQKAKKGLSRILSLSLTMLEKIEKLEMMVPEKFTHQNVTKVDIDQNYPERFPAQSAPLSAYDIRDFIRQHGDEYGVPTEEDWRIVFDDNLTLRAEMAKVIHAINSGHAPRNAAEVKMQIAEIMKRHEERKSTNVEALEEP